MGVLKPFSRERKPAALERLPSGCFTLHRGGELAGSTLPTHFSEEKMLEIGRIVLQAFQSAQESGLLLADLHIHYSGLMISARELRGGALIFLSPATMLLPQRLQTPDMTYRNLDEFILHLENYIECWKQFNHYVNQARDKNVAIERPGASSDQGPYGDLIASAGITPRLALPDFSAEYRHALGTSYVELAGILRNASWEDDDDSLDLDGSALCYGLNLTSNIKYEDLGSTIRLGVVFGQGIQNYMNDATVDIGVRPKENDPDTPIEGYAIPMLGVSAFVDHFWSPKASTTLGYSMIDMDLDEASDSSAFKTGSYALANIMFYPVPNVMWGVEFQYGGRENFKDDWTYEATRVQLSFKYNFGHTLYRKKKA